MKIRNTVAAAALTGALVIGGAGAAFAAPVQTSGMNHNYNRPSWVNLDAAWAGTASLNVRDAKVGTERVLTVTGLNKGETVTLTITNPDGTTTTLTATANRKGVATFTFTPTQAGKYTWAVTRTVTETLVDKDGNPILDRKGRTKTRSATVTIAQGRFRSFGKAGAPAATKPNRPQHPVTGAATALYAIGGTVLAAGGSTVLVAKRRTR